jgi:hypothetical protein
MPVVDIDKNPAAPSVEYLGGVDGRESDAQRQ